jgi:hypothetical protein
MAFEWASKKPTDGVATLYESNITLNKVASSHFETAHKKLILLGFDAKGKRIAIKPLSKEDLELGIFPEDKRHRITLKPSYARVSNKKFMKEVSDELGISLDANTSHKYKAIWSAEDQALVIDLMKEEA